MTLLAGNELPLERCPHCGVAKPRIGMLGGYHETQDSEGQSHRYWHEYVCASCGGVILAVTKAVRGVIEQMWPEGDTLPVSIPDRARAFLKQALDSLHAPSGAQILAASAVDAMLKAKGYKDGKLYTRIKAAEDDHLITTEMAEWAHEVRLDANEQRHDDEAAALPTQEEAKKTIEFAKALAQFLFVLPAMVKSGRGVAVAGAKTPSAAKPSSVTSSEPVLPPSFPGTT